MPESRNILLVVNPAAQRGRGARLGARVAARLREMGARATVRPTAARDDARRITREAVANRSERLDCLAACGGDGTVQEVAGALADARLSGMSDVPALGVVPAGRCNDFARALGIDRDVESVATTLAHGCRVPVDLGRANDHYFCTVATLGIDAEVSRFVDEMRMPLSGTAAYLYGTLRVLLRYRARQVRLEGDFGTIDEPLFMATTANTACYGGAIHVAPGASPTDGVLDVCVVGPLSKRRALRLLPTLLRGQHTGEPEVRLMRTRQLHVTTPEPSELWADGEPLAHTPVHLEAIPGAIDMLRPRRGIPT
ncbi:MAG TPA: diacylglycerol kinase family lipid kinase [Phycisphaerae bacterium]|nr:diacylglycerol kinase family lipid kinase [Phycisphaerae bacterium]HNU47046.1 diacylglycerol kinase family lipid kinase [Phycisphaerae bacterium]